MTTEARVIYELHRHGIYGSSKYGARLKNGPGSIRETGAGLGLGARLFYRRRVTITPTRNATAKACSGA